MAFDTFFGDQQLATSETSNPKQLQWHPAMIKWCLHLKLISSGVHHALRTIGSFTLLPSERTYTHYVKAGIGFSCDNQQLMKEANIKETDHFVVLVWDEMKVKEGLVFQ